MNRVELFVGFESSKFPVSECTVPNEREPGLMDSVASFLCVVVDPRFPSECRIRVLRPYTSPDLDDPGLLLYGWTDGGNWVDHFERSIHGDSERVVKWKRVEGDYRFITGDWHE